MVVYEWSRVCGDQILIVITYVTYMTTPKNEILNRLNYKKTKGVEMGVFDQIRSMSQEIILVSK